VKWQREKNADIGDVYDVYHLVDGKRVILRQMVIYAPLVSRFGQGVWPNNG
jgi:hypothetical protein